MFQYQEGAIVKLLHYWSSHHWLLPGLCHTMILTFTLLTTAGTSCVCLMFINILPGKQMYAGNLLPDDHDPPPWYNPHLSSSHLILPPLQPFSPSVSPSTRATYWRGWRRRCSSPSTCTRTTPNKLTQTSRRRRPSRTSGTWSRGMYVTECRLSDWPVC